MFLLLLLEPADELLGSFIDPVHGLVDNALILLAKMDLVFLSERRDTISLVMFCARPC
jgi:hypothetical protein